MRAKLREWQFQIHDTAILPEAERVRRAAENNLTVYELVRDPKLYDLPAYLDAADLALAQDFANRPKLVQFLHSPDSGLRYWGTVGLLMLGRADADTQPALESVLDDPCGEVSAMAAWVLINSGNPGKAQAALAGLLQKHSPATLMALNILDWAHLDLDPYIAAMDSLDLKDGYVQSMVVYLRESHGLPVPASMRKADEEQKKQNAKKDM
jgi:hypothetical protein